MVRALVVLAPGGAAGPGDPPGAPPRCRVLLARDFGAPGPGAPARQRLRRKEQLLVVARQVQTHWQLQQEATGRAPPPPPPAAATTADTAWLPGAPGGLFRLAPGEPFAAGATVAWLAAPGAALALVCEAGENAALAQAALRRLAPRLLPALRPAPGAPAAAHALLRRLLPHGQLLFLNERFARQLERDGA